MSEASDLTPLDRQVKIPIRLSETQKQAAIAAVASGLSQTQVAKQFGLHVNTVNRWMQAVKKVADSGLPSDWRSTMRLKAVDAVTQGLDCKDDPYKRGELGNKALIGLGEFKAGDQVSVNVLVNQISGLPEDWQNRYLAADDTTTPSIELPTNSATDLK